MAADLLVSERPSGALQCQEEARARLRDSETMPQRRFVFFRCVARLPVEIRFTG
jgi:hypothetical protein